MVSSSHNKAYLSPTILGASTSASFLVSRKIYRAGYTAPVFPLFSCSPSAPPRSSSCPSTPGGRQIGRTRIRRSPVLGGGSRQPPARLRPNRSDQSVISRIRMCTYLPEPASVLGVLGAPPISEPTCTAFPAVLGAGYASGVVLRCLEGA